MDPTTTGYVPPSGVTIAVICLCGFLYLWALMRRAISGRFDLYHIAMLAAVVLLPVGFVLFPRFVYRLSQSVGVAFPFVLLFASLFVSMFLYMHRVTSELNRATLRTRRLTQEIAILGAQIEAIRKGAEGPGPVTPA